MEENTNTSLMDTKLDDLTVGDYAKMNAVAFAASAGIVVVLVAAGAAYDKVSTWKYHRKMKKLEAENTPEDVK